jgi:hypothetical protein
VRVTLGMKLLFAAALAAMSLPWIAAVPAGEPHTGSAIVLVIEQPAAVDPLCPAVL